RCGFAENAGQGNSSPWRPACGRRTSKASPGTPEALTIRAALSCRFPICGCAGFRTEPSGLRKNAVRERLRPMRLDPARHCLAQAGRTGRRIGVDVAKDCQDITVHAASFDHRGGPVFYASLPSSTEIFKGHRTNGSGDKHRLVSILWDRLVEMESPFCKCFHSSHGYAFPIHVVR